MSQRPRQSSAFASKLPGVSVASWVKTEDGRRVIVGKEGTAFPIRQRACPKWPQRDGTQRVELVRGSDRRGGGG